jgi:hypothetical protein
METIDEAKELLRMTYPHMVEIRPDEFMGTWDAFDGRMQNLYIRFYKSKVLFTSAFANISQISAQSALLLAQETTHGIVLDGDKFAIRQVTSLKNFDEFELHSGALIAGIADHLEKQVVTQDLE